MGALIGLMGNQAHAGSITLSVDLNGVVIYSVTSTSPDDFVNANLTALNHALTQAGSAYQFGPLGATSNYTGSSFASLTTTGTVNMTGTTGTTAAVLSVDTTQSGFLSPLSKMYAIGSASGTYAGATGTMTFTGDVDGTNLRTLDFPFPNSTPGLYAGSTFPPPVSFTLPSGFSLSNHFTFDFAYNPLFLVTLPGSVEVSSVPEPASIVIFLTGMTLPLALAFGFIRRRLASGPVRPRVG